MKPNKKAGYCFAFESHSGCFDLLTTEEQTLFELHSNQIIYRKGETLIKQGSFASSIQFIESGLVKLFLEGNPRNLILNIIPPSHFIGLEAIFETNETFPYTVTAYSETTTRSIDMTVFRQIARKNSALAYRLLTIVNENINQNYNRFYSLTRKQLHGRLADILLCLSNKIFHSTTFDLPLSRADLGELTSMSTESVIRLMKEFKDDGLIEMKTKSVSLLDIPRLQRISELG